MEDSFLDDIISHILFVQVKSIDCRGNSRANIDDEESTDDSN